jgi:hypothetical protein
MHAIRRLDKRPSIFITGKPISSPRRYYIKTMTARVQFKKISGLESQGVWHQDEVIGGRPPVVKYI